MVESKFLMLNLHDPNLQTTLKQLEQEGWQMVPGFPPQVLYVIHREVAHMMKGEGFGQLQIDESQLYFIDKDGNRVDRH